MYLNVVNKVGGGVISSAATLLFYKFSFHFCLSPLLPVVLVSSFFKIPPLKFSLVVALRCECLMGVKKIRDFTSNPVLDLI